MHTYTTCVRVYTCNMHTRHALTTCTYNIRTRNMHTLQHARTTCAMDQTCGSAEIHTVVFMRLLEIGIFCSHMVQRNCRLAPCQGGRAGDTDQSCH